MAYSDKINDASFQRYKTVKVVMRIVLYCVLTALAGIVIFVSGKIDSIAVKAAFFIGAALLLLVVLNMKQIVDRTWDGVVLDRTARYISKMNTLNKADQQDRSIRHYVESTVKIQRDDGKIFTHIYRKPEISPYVEFYFKGDRVRHHAHMKLYEKEDKSKDMRILCNCCLHFTRKEDDVCASCGRPLLK